MDAARWVRDAYGYMQTPELDALESVIESLDDNSIAINIGAGFGTSGLAFIQNPKIVQLYTVELFEYMKDSGLGSLEFERGSFARFGYDKDPRYMQINMDSIQCGKAWPYGKVDMIFLDGDHTRDHCHKDIEVWLPHIKQGGIFAFHDYHEPNWMGVTESIDELLVPYYPMISQAACFVAFRIENKNV